ncbi:hypothetical protein GW17_00011192 [Ensete ventricosum]|nr:hypothetical protein GW17_00011192 [Ensete ventricosum]
MIIPPTLLPSLTTIAARHSPQPLLSAAFALCRCRRCRCSPSSSLLAAVAARHCHCSPLSLSLLPTSSFLEVNHLAYLLLTIYC